MFTDLDARDSKFSGVPIDWGSWNSYLQNVVCRCAQVSKAEGFYYFGVKNFGRFKSKKTLFSILGLCFHQGNLYSSNCPEQDSRKEHYYRREWIIRAGKISKKQRTLSSREWRVKRTNDRNMERRTDVIWNEQRVNEQWQICCNVIWDGAQMWYETNKGWTNSERFVAMLDTGLRKIARGRPKNCPYMNDITVPTVNPLHLGTQPWKSVLLSVAGY